MVCADVVAYSTGGTLRNEGRRTSGSVPGQIYEIPFLSDENIPAKAEEMFKIIQALLEQRWKSHV